MKKIYVFRNEEGKICGSASYAENGEEIQIDDPEYLEFVKNSENPAPTWETIRQKRDELIKSSDWIFLPDANPKPSKEAWLEYRQALRDIPSKFKTPTKVKWPTI